MSGAFSSFDKLVGRMRREAADRDAWEAEQASKRYRPQLPPAAPPLGVPADTPDPELGDVAFWDEVERLHGHGPADSDLAEAVRRVRARGAA